MSKLKELIDKLCPDGVEYKKLGDVCFFADGLPIKADDIKEQGLYPVIKIGNIINGIVVEQKHYLTELPPKIKKSQILEGGEILVGMSGSTGKTGYNSLQNAVVNQRIAIIRNSDLVLNGYLKHCLVNNNFESYCFQIGNGPQHNISKFDLLAFEIPLPPIEVQEEIVRILDNFTKCTAELQAELQAREEQYEYYRNKLLSFEGRTDVEYKKLGEVCKVLRGKRLTTKELSSNFNIPVYHGGVEPIGYYDKSNRKANSTMLINVGASAGTVGFCNKEFWSSDGCFCFSHNDLIMQKFLFYALQSIENIIKAKVRKAGIPTLDNKEIERISIPLPPIEVQERIVSVLDKFETLVKDLSQGLPAEIEARQNQYEYYRNKLLTFNKILSA